MVKAKINLNGKSYFIPITEEVYRKFRVMEELASMSLEVNPMLHPNKKELEDLPYIYWKREDFANKTHTEIELVLVNFEKEFEIMLQAVILINLGIELKEGENISFMDSYVSENKDEYVFAYDIEIMEYDRDEYFEQVIADILDE